MLSLHTALPVLVVGKVGDGWKQVVSELAFERSGPERFLSTFVVLREGLRELGRLPNDGAAASVGRLVAQLKSLRRMSLGVNGLLQQGESPVAAAALVKDVGTRYERTVLRSEEHTSELQSLMRIAYAVLCLKKKKKIIQHNN